VGLHVEPEGVADAEHFAQAERGVGGDGPLAVDDFV
jgi:hypothetical protein